MNEMEKRALAREDEWYNLTTQQLRRLKRYYELTATELIKEIEALYGRYGKENRLPPSEARRLIRGKEFREWRMSLEEYVSRSKGDEKLLLELNTLAMRSRINRLDVLYSKTLMELGDLSERLKDFSDAFFYRSYVEHYYGTLYDIGQEVGLKTPPVELDRAKVAAVLQTNWSGRLYDERIRAQRRRYSVAIKETILRAVHKGESIDKLSRRLSEKMQSDYKSAELLVRTEVNYFQNRAAAEAIRDADFTHYQFVATLDRRTCARCGNRDGEIYPLSELNQGENAPPLHPRCRCTIIASFGEKMTGSRISEGRKKIPAETSYKEWRNGIGKPKSKNTADDLKRVAADDKIKQTLQETMTASKIKGELMYPPPKMDLTSFKFDAEHTQGDKHPHDVTEEEARHFIDEAYFAIVKYNGNSYNYYGHEGAAFVRMDLQTIRTAFKAEEYDEKIRKLIEVYENG